MLWSFTSLFYVSFHFFVSFDASATGIKLKSDIWVSDGSTLKKISGKKESLCITDTSLERTLFFRPAGVRYLEVSLHHEYKCMVYIALYVCFDAFILQRRNGPVYWELLVSEIERNDFQQKQKNNFCCKTRCHTKKHCGVKVLHL